MPTQDSPAFHRPEISCGPGGRCSFTQVCKNFQGFLSDALPAQNAASNEVSSAVKRAQFEGKLTYFSLSALISM